MVSKLRDDDPGGGELSGYEGGRQVDGAIASIDALALVMQSVRVKEVQASGKFTILFDSGIRSGSDVLKALALGAQGVMSE